MSAIEFLTHPCLSIINNGITYMKPIYSFIILALTIFILSSCSSTMKCTVYGEPYTKIYTSKGDYLGEISSSGSTNLSINRKNRHDFLLSRQSSTSPLIPIGLDYSKRSMGFRNFCTAFFSLPTLCIATVPYANYLDNLDVDDELKLNAKQSSNQDLEQLMLSSSKPVDEINRLTIKTKSGNQNKKTSSIDPSLFNRTGEYSDLKSMSILKDGEKLSLEITGTIFFDFTYDSLPIISISAKSGDKLEYNYDIPLETPFYKKGTKLLSKDEDNNEVVIESTGNDYYVITYTANGALFNL